MSRSSLLERFPDTNALDLIDAATRSAKLAMEISLHLARWHVLLDPRQRVADARSKCGNTSQAEYLAEEGIRSQKFGGWN